MHGKLYLTASGGFKGGYEDETLIGLAKVAKDEQVNLLIVEDNFADGMFTKIFQPVLNKYYFQCSLKEEKVHSQKELRVIQDLEPVMNSHRLVVNKSILEKELQELERDDKQLPYLLFYQLTRITKDRGCLKHDDRLDALAGAVRYWVNAMARDSEEAAEDWEIEMLQKYQENFIEQITGFTGVASGKPANPNWISKV